MAVPASLPKVVVACTSESRAVLAEALSNIASPLMALSETEALRFLDAEVRLLVCTLRFDDSRMLDFLRCVHERFSQLPCVCCRVSRTRLPLPSLHAALVAALSVGAAEAIDFYGLESTLGHEAAIDVLRGHLAARLA